jgi:hypothetical protein
MRSFHGPAAVAPAGGARAGLAQLQAAVDRMQQEDVGELETAELGTQLIDLRRQIDQLEAAWSERLERFDALAGWKGEATSIKGWLRATTRMAKATAGSRVRAARRLRDLPQIADSYAQGRISTAHVTTITRAVTDERVGDFGAYESIVANAAERLDPPALGKVMARWRALVDPDGSGDDHARARDARRLSISPVGDGVATDGWHDAEDGEEIQQSINAVMERDRRPNDPRTPAQRRADALATICREYRALADLPDRHTQRPAVAVTIPWASLSAPNDAGLPGDLEWGGTISAATARRLACDADLTRIITGPDGAPLDVGRRSRTVTGPIWKALVARDGGCVFPLCNRPPAWTEAHHVVHWAFDGPTSLDNTALLCHEDHHNVHEGGWHLATDIATRRWVAHGPEGQRIVAEPSADDYTPTLLSIANGDPPPGDSPWVREPDWYRRLRQPAVASEGSGRYETGRYRHEVGRVGAWPSSCRGPTRAGAAVS